MKQKLIQVLPPAWLEAGRSMKFLLSGDYLRLRRRLEELERAYHLSAQSSLPAYHGILGPYRYQSTINRYEHRIYSQNGEDGILLYLFSLLGTTDRRFVEFGIGDGRQCNTANLSLNFGWSGLLMDIDPSNVQSAQVYYGQQLGQQAKHVQVMQAHVTADNINQNLADQGYTGELDLLSIDIDSNDYWIWHAIDVIQPRLVVIEYNASLGDQRRLVVPYQANFRAGTAHVSGFYHGASLAALALLGEQKGYILAGCESAGINAFFVRQDVAQARLIPQSPADAYFPHAYRTTLMNPAAQFDLIRHLPFTEL